MKVLSTLIITILFSQLSFAAKKPKAKKCMMRPLLQKYRIFPSKPGPRKKIGRIWKESRLKDESVFLAVEKNNLANTISISFCFNEDYTCFPMVYRGSSEGNAEEADFEIFKDQAQDVGVNGLLALMTAYMPPVAALTIPTAIVYNILPDQKVARQAASIAAQLDKDCVTEKDIIAKESAEAFGYLRINSRSEAISDAKYKELEDNFDTNYFTPGATPDAVDAGGFVEPF